MKKFETGLATSTTLIVIALVGFFLTLLFKMGPAYLDNQGLKSAMASMVDNNPDIHEMSKDEIRSAMSRYFSINSVRDFSVRDMDIIRKNDKTLINFIYEKRVPIFLNIDVVMSFKNQIDSSNLDACCDYLVDTHADKKAK